MTIRKPNWLPELRWAKDELADLHIHSAYSDGRHTPRELAEMAAEIGLRVISLTDHACIDGIAETTLEAAKLGIYTIPGVELNGENFDFLGYFIDYGDKRFLSFLQDVICLRSDRVKQVLNQMRRLGFHIDWKALAEFAAPAAPSRSHLARMLADSGRFPTVGSAFRELLGPSGPAYVPSEGPADELCASMIRRAGGLAVIAHPHFIRDLSPEAIPALCEKFAAWGVCGYERIDENGCDPEIVSAWEKAGRENGLLALDGSNFHGRGISEARMGGGVVGCDMIPELVRRLPEGCIHKSMFKRMRWRSANLSLEEFESSLSPEPVTIEKLGFERLLKLSPHFDSTLGKDAAPFVLCGPGAFHRRMEIAGILKELGFRITRIETGNGYPEVAWSIYRMFRVPDNEKPYEILRFDLDRHLWGNDAERFGVIFFANEHRADLRQLKQTIRGKMGSIRFYRVYYKDISETYLTTYVHIPDEENIGRECRILSQFGIQCH